MKDSNEGSLEVEINMFFTVMAEIRHRMTPSIVREDCGGDFPNFIAIASHFHTKQNAIFGRIKTKDAIPNAAKFLGISEDSPIFSLKNSDPSVKVDLQPSCEEIEIALRRAVNGEDWNFNQIQKELSNAG